MQSQGYKEAKGGYTSIRRRCQSVSQEEKAEGNEKLLFKHFSCHFIAIVGSTSIHLLLGRRSACGVAYDDVVALAAAATAPASDNISQ